MYYIVRYILHVFTSVYTNSMYYVFMQYIPTEDGRGLMNENKITKLLHRSYKHVVLMLSGFKLYLCLELYLGMHQIVC